MITLDTGNNYDVEINDIYKKLYTVNSYLTALTQISSLTYLTSLSTLTSYASEINEIENSIYSLTTDLNNYLKKSETSSLTFNSSVLSLSDYVKTSDTGAFTSPWDTISTSTLNNYLLSSETSSLTFNSSVLSLSDYLKVSETSNLTSPWDTISTSTLNNYLLSSDYVSFDSSVLNSYLLSSKTTDFAGSTIATLSTLSSLTYLTTLSNTPYMINAEITNPNLYLYNVSSMSNFNGGTIMGDYTMGYVEEIESNSIWMNSYDHVLSLKGMTNCKFSFEHYDTSYYWEYSNRRIGFSANNFYSNTFTFLNNISGEIFSRNQISKVNHITGNYASKNSFYACTDVKLLNERSNYYSYVNTLSVYSAEKCSYTGLNVYNGGYVKSCTFSECGSIAIYNYASLCSFTNSIPHLYMSYAEMCSGYADNCTIVKGKYNYLTARSFTIGSASSCTFQTCDSINFIALYSPQMWAPHYLKGGSISSGSITGSDLVMDVGYIDGVYMGNVCRGTISFNSMGRPFTIASAGYPQDIVVSYNLHPYRWASDTYYFSLSADLSSSFTLHVYNIQNVRPSFQNATISNYLCLDVLGPRGVFSNGSYSYASLTQYCPTSRLSYNGVPWQAIQH